MTGANDRGDTFIGERKLGVVARIGTFWSAVAVLVLLGAGTALGVSRSSGRVAIDR